MRRKFNFTYLLDPATGRPVDEIMQATVIDPDPLLADAGATALVVAGTDRWQHTADSLAAERSMVIDAEGTVSSLDTAPESGR